MPSLTGIAGLKYAFSLKGTFTFQEKVLQCYLKIKTVILGAVKSSKNMRFTFHDGRTDVLKITEGPFYAAVPNKKTVPNNEK